MIELPEQYNGPLDCATSFWKDAVQEYGLTYSRTVERKSKQAPCYELDCNNKQIKTSYFIGVDWIVENKSAIYVRPKLNREALEIDYLKMLIEALEEPENINHLNDLIHIDFNKPTIAIQQKDDLLSPFLIAQFIQILRRIVQKGLKKVYYSVEENLNSRIKGKILINKNIRKNISRGNKLHNVCQYQEYGINHAENKLLKKALIFSKNILGKYGKGTDINALKQAVNYISPAFRNVSEDINTQQIKQLKGNPIYVEYSQAIKLAQLILKRFSYSISSLQQEQHSTPPFWIDMSQLFELYVYKKLRVLFSNKEVNYLVRTYRSQELDFLLKPLNNIPPYIIDAKYKPRYENQCISIDDIRQVSGYSRIESIYKKLGIKDYTKNINCLIIYSHQDCDDDLKLSQEGELVVTKEKGYVNIFKIGIRLPEVEKQIK